MAISDSQNVYNDMVSMSNEYYNSIGNFGYGSVTSPTTGAGQQSSTEDSTTSLLGTLQQVLGNTVKLIASSDTVGKDPQQERRENEKLGVQEEAEEAETRSKLYH
ncbi:hypothetical protein OS493_035828 [Desmophyllum pertusum]|uniref:Uncharacterized protein n=1 Tax=Desmophyllum pertusum TaxID=174260 RepID=A0A9W9Y7L5_9CNID|nr:hypothetical protein OS493_035828 [Desmophyllum pertusum]